MTRGEFYTNLIDLTFPLMCEVSEASVKIEDGEIVDEEDTTNMLLDFAECLRAIKDITGRNPIDIEKRFVLKGVQYDGTYLSGDEWEIRRTARDVSENSSSIDEFEYARLVYFLSREGKVVPDKNNNEEERRIG